jgi:hypothetical protein
MPPQPRRRTGPVITRRAGFAVTTGALAMAYVGLASTPAAAAECPPGKDLVSTLTGVVCATTDTATSAGKDLLDKGTGGVTGPVTGTVKKSADGLASGVHGAARSPRGGIEGVAGRGASAAPGDDDRGEDASRRSAQRPWTAFPGGFTRQERAGHLDARLPAPPYPASLPGLPPRVPEVAAPEVAPRHPPVLRLVPDGAAARIAQDGGPSTVVVAIAAGAAGAVVALHLGLVDTWRRRRRTPRR